MSRSPRDDERLADWVDGNLSAKELSRFEAELRVNPELAEAAAEYRDFVERMQRELKLSDTEDFDSAETTAVPEGEARTDLTGRIMAGLPATKAKVHRFPLIASIAAAAAIAMVYVGMRYLPRPSAEMIANSSKTDDRSIRDSLASPSLSRGFEAEAATRTSEALAPSRNSLPTPKAGQLKSGKPIDELRELESAERRPGKEHDRDLDRDLFDRIGAGKKAKKTGTLVQTERQQTVKTDAPPVLSASGGLIGQPGDVSDSRQLATKDAKSARATQRRAKASNIQPKKNPNSPGPSSSGPKTGGPVAGSPGSPSVGNTLLLGTGPGTGPGTGRMKRSPGTPQSPRGRQRPMVDQRDSRQSAGRDPVGNARKFIGQSADNGSAGNKSAGNGPAKDKLAAEGQAAQTQTRVKGFNKKLGSTERREQLESKNRAGETSTRARRKGSRRTSPTKSVETSSDGFYLGAANQKPKRSDPRSSQPFVGRIDGQADRKVSPYLPTVVSPGLRPALNLLRLDASPKDKASEADRNQGRLYLVVDLPYPLDVVSSSRTRQTAKQGIKKPAPAEAEKVARKQLSWPAFAQAFARQPTLLAPTVGYDFVPKTEPFPAAVPTVSRKLVAGSGLVPVKGKSAGSKSPGQPSSGSHSDDGESASRPAFEYLRRFSAPESRSKAQVSDSSQPNGSRLAFLSDDQEFEVRGTRQQLDLYLQILSQLSRPSPTASLFKTNLAAIQAVTLSINPTAKLESKDAVPAQELDSDNPKKPSKISAEEQILTLRLLVRRAKSAALGPRQRR